MILTIPMPPNVTNRRQGSTHWRRLYNDKQAYWARLDDLQGIGILPSPPSVPYRLASIASTMFLGCAMDDDNAMGRHKPVLDWLKTRGYIQDDRKKNLVWEALPAQIIKRDGNYRILLSLTPLDHV